MSEIFIPMPKDININEKFDGYFIGLKDFSSNFNYVLDIDELDSFLENIDNKKTFICFNRLIFNDEIDRLKEILNILKDKDITGICFTDLGVLELAKEVNFNKELLWYSNHLGTNSNTIKFLNKRDVNFFLLSTEITKDEIIQIKNNCPNQIIGCTLYGYLNMATSSRKLLTNYFKYINKEKINDKYIMKDKINNNDYIVVEKENTNFFTGNILNGINFYPELLKNNIDFIFIDDYMIENNEFSNIINMFSSVRENKKIIDNNTYNGFLDKKTVFKVEDYE